MLENAGIETEHRMVKIHINREPYDSPERTTGIALYHLGKIPHGFELFQTGQGDAEDKLIRRTNDPTTVHQGEHFYSEPEVKIIVNGTPYEWTRPEISYAEVVTLEDPDYPKHPEKTYSVKYKHGPNHKPEGILSPGASVKVKKGMVFNVSETGQS